MTYLMHAPIYGPGDAISVHMHHTESVDPTLAAWINDLLHDLLGWGPWTFVVVLGVAIALIPAWLIYTALRHPDVREESENEDD